MKVREILSALAYVITCDDPRAKGEFSIPIALTAIFVVFKLGGLVHWSWWWVLSPIWIVLSVVATTVTVLAIYARWQQ